VISATLRNLEEEMAHGRFRDDLLYRLNVISIHLPPLRERPEDISVLIEHFLQKHSKRLGISEKKLPPEVAKLLLEYPWPGNARELENCLERALVLSEGDTIQLSALPPYIAASGSIRPAVLSQGDTTSLSIKERTAQLELDLITKALAHTKGNKTQAAKVLEISHRTLLYKLKEYGIT
jgi:two-component system response regulator AtoC